MKELSEWLIVRSFKGRQQQNNLTVGGVVGENRENANVTGIQVKVGVTTDSSALIGFKDYQYLGGIVRAKQRNSK